MKKELRGRKTNDFRVEYVTDLSRLKDPSYIKELTDEDIQNLNREYNCSLSAISNTEDAVSKIKESILKMYNDDITPAVMLLYCFLSWYRKTVKKIEKKGTSEYRKRIVDFESAINDCANSSIGSLLSQKNDNGNIDNLIMHEKYKLISMIKARVIASDKSDCLSRLEHIIKAVIQNCFFLHLIDTNYKVDNYFLLQWEYYPVDKVFRDVIDTFDSELNRSAYKELSGKEYFYYNKIKRAEVDFSSIKSLEIVRDGKNRTVHIANKPLDRATLIYLSKRLNAEFHIVYPNRDKIMELSFNLIDSLTRLDNYTIFKFDFQDFFNSVQIKKVYDKYIENSNLYSFEKELILKLAKKYTKCVQGLPTSNALIEIISRDFDEKVKTAFSEDGLVFYKRYVDDCLLIFNHMIKKDVLNKAIKECLISTFGNKVLLSPSKTSYQTKLDGDDTFDYLGYSFTRAFWNKPTNIKKHYYYFEFGIAGSKIEKYKKQLDTIFAAYNKDGNERLLLRRIQYFNSRIVFYNYVGSKYVNKSTWDVRGVINSYRMLRRYVILDDCNIKGKNAGKKTPYRIQKETYKFLQYYVEEKRKSLGAVPQYLQGKGCYEHTLWNGLIKNKSIVFQPNIGWSNELLSARLIEVGGSTARKSYYEKTREYYTLLIKKLKR